MFWPLWHILAYFGTFCKILHYLDIGNEVSYLNQQSTHMPHEVGALVQDPFYQPAWEKHQRTEHQSV